MVNDKEEEKKNVKNFTFDLFLKSEKKSKKERK